MPFRRRYRKRFAGRTVNGQPVRLRGRKRYGYRNIRRRYQRGSRRYSRFRRSRGLGSPYAPRLGGLGDQKIVVCKVGHIQDSTVDDQGWLSGALNGVDTPYNLQNPFNLSTTTAQASGVLYDGTYIWQQNYERYEIQSIYWKITIINPTQSNYIKLLVYVGDNYNMPTVPNMDGLPVSTEFDPQQLDDSPRMRIIDIPPQQKRTVKLKINAKTWARKAMVNLEDRLGTCSTDNAPYYSGLIPPNYQVRIMNIWWCPNVSALQTSFDIGVTKQCYAKIRFLRRRQPWVRDIKNETEDTIERQDDPGV